MADQSILLSHLTALYSDSIGRAAFERLRLLLDRYRSQISAPRAIGLDQRNAILITYADQVREPGVLPLRTLANFCERFLEGIVSGIHILPFYPSSSDDGFSVIDYRAVDPAFGDWDDVTRLGQRFQLMFDAVVNHVSARSEWFQRFLRDDPVYGDYFIVVRNGADLSRVVRPRSLPLLNKFVTPSGEKSVWTTFSRDQIDLNYHNPNVLLEIVETILFYISRGAEFIRLDAVAYLWKEIGTPCTHLTQTHRVIQLLRAVLDDVAPHVMLITETNVPHAENVSYFGDGTNEAQLVYNFALPPLTLHAFHTGNAATLTRWASGLSLPSKRVTFFNFLASHDGIGLNPARGILGDADIDALVEKTIAHGGLISYKDNADRTPSPYELNINYFDALSNPNSDEPMDTQVDRFIAAQAIMLSLVGVPGIYFHSLFGSRGWREGVEQTGGNRTVNRQKCDRAALENELANINTRRYQVFTRYKRLLEVRAVHRSFDPHGEQRILHCVPAVFAVLRTSPDRKEQVLCLHNVSDQPCTVDLDLKAIGFQPGKLIDLIAGEGLQTEQRQGLHLRPYQVLWLCER